MEKMLHYIWKHRLYPSDEFRTHDGALITVIDPGIYNTDAGPDFFNAKIRIGTTVWVGNIEIHNRASDWILHRHDRDKMYDNVILHVVRHDDCKVYYTNNVEVRQVVLPVPVNVETNIEWLLSRDTPVPCEGNLFNIPAIYLSDWLTTLLMERLERKTQDVEMRLSLNSKDWNETFYITLMRNFGFGTNSDIFEMLAKSLPFKHILKHRNNPLQIEALFFGQAGLLDDVSISDPSRGFEPFGNYANELRTEYSFLRKKYNLQPVSGFLFRNLRTRPVNFPHVRLAQAAAVWTHNDLLFSKILETEDLVALRKFFNVEPSPYWSEHYNFNTVHKKDNSCVRRKSIGANATNIILINTVAPILFAYGKIKKRDNYCERALRLLEKIPAERNAIVTLFGNAGVKADNAGDSQALIQLQREYCEKKKCLYCRIGYRVLADIMKSYS
ncbi:MAG: DUF2851 family protein [Tannerella sp.]|jgi:hypothetical protein|nr:DUF2851 family protein [Tannerella sp.]